MAENKLSRRNFLKILGASTAVGAAGCADKATEKIVPYVNPVREQITGVPVWYSSTCGECSAGCGIRVRTREGRAVKIEGNPDSPINEGGLCAMGQSALQDLYDPDRVRQPLMRAEGGGFAPISWSKAIRLVTERISAAKRKVSFTGPGVRGVLDTLMSDWCELHDVERVHCDPSEPVAEAKAAQLVFGNKDAFGVPKYHLDRAEIVLSLGADFLETWISPVEYARAWAKGRKAHTPLKLVHVEPRMSLTGANADLWLKISPGREALLARGILKALLEKGRGKSLSSWVHDAITDLVADIDLNSVASETGVSLEKILLVVKYLSEAKQSLVIAGGASVASAQPLPVMVLANLINLVLGNIGKTIDTTHVREVKGSLSAVQTSIEAMQRAEVDLLIVHGANPLYSLPPSFEFGYAIKKVKTLICFASHLDETASQAELVLPIHTSLEAWGDAKPYLGVHALQQPSMKPVFDTKHIGDLLLTIAAKSQGKSSAGGIAQGASDFYSYLRAAWKKEYGSRPGGFDTFWKSAVERGGVFAKTRPSRSRVRVDKRAFKLDFGAVKFAGRAKDPILLPYNSVKTFDGRAANRAWMQELPDPMTQIVWDAWVEMHPDTARKHNLARGDMVTVRNKWGELTAPVYESKFVHPDVIAVPRGQGHNAYGRFATQVAGNAVELLPKVVDADSGALAMFNTRVELTRGRGKGDLVIPQGSHDQLNRELARTSVVAAGAGHHANGHHGDDHHGGHGAHHEPKQMYEQREHPIYDWGLAVDLDACTGCSACVVACYAENNIPVVGKKVVGQGRGMSWINIQRYVDGSDEDPLVQHLPMMCQHCNNAPCEPVCPVYATYHNEEGLNAMVYNRCVGTRYCANNCSYKVRRFNWYQYDFPEPLNWQLNPDIALRNVGVMEKCTFCVQRIIEAKDMAKDMGHAVADGDVQPACVQSCPTQALTFGNLNDANSRVSKLSKDERAYKILDHHLNTQPSISYLENVKYKL
mgnify:CR=1 FL=1